MAGPGIAAQWLIRHNSAPWLTQLIGGILWLWAQTARALLMTGRVACTMVPTLTMARPMMMGCEVKGASDNRLGAGCPLGL